MIHRLLSLGSKNLLRQNENEATRVKNNAQLLGQNFPKTAIVFRVMLHPTFKPPFIYDMQPCFKYKKHQSYKLYKDFKSFLINHSFVSFLIELKGRAESLYCITPFWKKILYYVHKKWQSYSKQRQGLRKQGCQGCHGTPTF